MTNYYMTSEAYDEKVKEDQKIIDKLNAEEISMDEADEQLQELWNVGKREQKKKTKVKMKKDKKEQKCLMDEARKDLAKRIGEERARSYPLYISCPCPRCSPQC
ncbi:hypothetical protein LCGC14_0556580 [marine sediment metagenome]|uniref:Uncharacterized protein n=1 Tax=marine sediment metagenome TaxID=412755 RepID=A0A0F9RN76_9ZZZZ